MYWPKALVMVHVNIMVMMYIPEVHFDFTIFTAVCLSVCLLVCLFICLFFLSLY